MKKDKDLASPPAADVNSLVIGAIWGGTRRRDHFRYTMAYMSNELIHGRPFTMVCYDEAYRRRVEEELSRRGISTSKLHWIDENTPMLGLKPPSSDIKIESINHF